MREGVLVVDDKLAMPGVFPLHTDHALSSPLNRSVSRVRDRLRNAEKQSPGEKGPKEKLARWHSFLRPARSVLAMFRSCTVR